MVSTGNEFDLSLGEICLAAVEDPQVASFALFLENLSHADDLAAFARAAAASAASRSSPTSSAAPMTAPGCRVIAHRRARRR